MAKKDLALLLGITGNLAFAAGCLLLALQRHSPHLNADIILFHDAHLLLHDSRLLQRLGAQLRPYRPPEEDFDAAAIAKFSFLCLAKLEAFRLLDSYRHVIWLDADTAIQDDITPLKDYGPLSLAVEDPHFTEQGKSTSCKINVRQPVPDLDFLWPNYNSGVLVAGEELTEYGDVYGLCLEMLSQYAPVLKYPDQGILNMLIQKLHCHHPHLFRPLPVDLYNAHPRNPLADKAALLHAFGAYKLWDDGLTRCAFPEWARDYERWLHLGGTGWQGEVSNPQCLRGGAFYLLRGLFDSIAAAQNSLERMARDLDRERQLRSRLEKLLAREGHAHKP
ncbi:MAG: glycosyl transferase family 8 [Desulfovibrio sp.]|nr:glycosyl transferase family 8 [Desulfovibrio sp.]